MLLQRPATISSLGYPTWALWTKSDSAKTVHLAAILTGFLDFKAILPKSSTSIPSLLACDDKKAPVPAAHNVFMA